MERTFTTRINLGNAAMSSPRDVAEALRKVAAQLDDDASGYPEGLIRDDNGNTVGRYTFDPETADAPLIVTN